MQKKRFMSVAWARAGFTLIELLVVIAIIAIVAALLLCPKAVSLETSQFVVSG